MLYLNLLFIHLLYATALHGTRPIVSLFADAQGGSAILIGLLVSSFAFLPMLLAVQVGRWLDQFGPKRMLALGGSGIFISLVVPIMYPSIGTLFFSQVLMGLSQVCVVVSIQKTIGNFPGERDKHIATLSFAGAAGTMLGPLISGFSYEYFGFQISFSFYAILTLTSFIFILFLRQKLLHNKDGVPHSKGSQPSSSWHMLKQTDLRKALIISGLAVYSKELYVAYFPIYAHHLGVSPSHIGIIIAIMAGTGMVVRFAQFKLVKVFGRARVLTTTLIISGMAFILIPFTSIPITLTLLSAILGAGLGLGQPLSLVYSLNVSPKGRQGEVLGVRITINRASVFLAPIIFGGIGGIVGVPPIFWASGSVLLIGSYFTHLSPSNETKRN